ncbi:Ig-like domain-containing protein [Roseobacteraceae bacterium NS-SX3]
MSIVAYITRDMAGTIGHGEFPEGTPARIDASLAKDVSLNLSPEDVESYARRGSALHITLANGEVLILDNYFDFSATGGKNLFLSEEGNFIEVVLEDRDSGMLYASYEPLDLSGKWSAYDEMVFLDVDRIEPVVAPLAAPLVGGLGAAGAAAAGAAGLAVVAGGGDSSDGSGDGSDGSGGSVLVPTVDNPDATHPVASATTDPVVITGTGTPGSAVTVTVGGVTGTGTVAGDGTWEVSFPVTDLPDDGVYDTTVHVEDPDGNTFDLDGPTVHIDTTPPVAEATSGTQSTGDLVNAEEQADGPVITGTGEAGAEVVVEINGYSHSTTVAEDGTWSVAFEASEIATGEYETGITITTTDSFGNSSTTTDVLEVDTVAPPVAVDTVEGDDQINYIEAADGVTLTGTGEAGAAVEVSFQGITRSTTVASDGTWSVDYGSDEIAGGVYESEISVTTSDAAGNSSTTTHTVQVDTETRVTLDTQVGGDSYINGAEQAAGITLTGTADAGASVTVDFHGTTRTVTADSDGNWSANFASSEIAAGEYDATVTATATDGFGNTSSTSGTIQVDTSTWAAINSGQAGGDNIVNEAEAAAGVTLTGTAEPGAAVEVTVAGVTRTATVDSTGNWSATFEAGSLAAGEYDTAVTVTATDAAGNSSSASAALRVDTVAGDVALSPNPIELDDTINAVERADGVEISGTATPGLTVTVGLGTASAQVVADASGSWSTTFPASEIPEGTSLLPITASIIDDAGNTASVSDSVALDTVLSPLTVAAAQTSDDVVNVQELAAGLTLTGTVEPGSTVMITVEGVTRAATVDSAGNWSAEFTDSDIPGGTYDTTASITATDAAGNTATVTEDFSVDTEYETPSVDSVTFAGPHVRRIGTEGSTDSYSVNALEDDGSVTEPNATVTYDRVFGTEFTFQSPVPDGTHLVVTSEDDAGNASSTLVVLEDNATNSGTLDHAGLPQFNIDELNLDYASDVTLTLTEADIQALSGNSDTLTVHGGTDDTLAVSNAVSAGSRVVDGQSYNVYTVGNDGTTLLVDQDVNMVI